MAVRGCMQSCVRRRVRCSKQRVARLMREMELAAKRRRHKPVGTTRTKGAAVAPNVLNREFEVETPNRTWVSDTTYVWTREGWLYVAVILDLFSRQVVGWAMSQHNDEQLVRQALEMAVARRCPRHPRCWCIPIRAVPIPAPAICIA